MPLKTNYKNISWNGLRKYQLIQNQDGTVSFLDVTEYTNVQDAKVLANDLNSNNDLVNRIMAGEFFYTEAESDALLALKQNVLTFDNVPTANSDNPVKSGGVKSALDLINSRIDNLKVFAIHVCQSGEYDPDTLIPTVQNPDTETFYLVPSGTGSDVFTEWIYLSGRWEIFGSSQIDMSNYVTVTDLQDALDDKQDVLTFDNVPTANSDNPVKSGGVKSALDGKSDTGHDHDDRYYTDSETDILLSGKSDTGHDHDDRYYTETEADALLNGKRNVSDSYTKTEIDTLLSAKSDNIHNHDNRYYTETEVDTLVDDLQDQIDAINNFAIHICSSAEYDPDTLIPTIQNPSENTFYLVPDGSGDDMYNEWIYINNAWEKFGSTRIDLSQYYTKSEADILLNAKQNTLTFDNTPTANSNNPVKSGGIKSALDGKAAAVHVHGNISDSGAITADTAVGSGDKLVLADSSDSGKLIRSGISFDGVTTSKGLTPKGTFESFAPGVHSHGSILDSGDSRECTMSYSKPGLSTASWIGAWNGYELGAISASNLRKVLGTARPMFKRQRVNLGNVTLNENGFLDVSSFIPAAPAGYSLFVAVAGNWSSMRPVGIFSVMARGDYVLGSAGMSIVNLRIDYYFVLSEEFGEIS